MPIIRKTKVTAELQLDVSKEVRDPSRWMTDKLEEAVASSLIEGWSQVTYGIDPDDELGYVGFTFKCSFTSASSIDGLFAVAKDVADLIAGVPGSTIESVEVF